MNLEEKIQNAETRIFKVVFPKIANHHETMFGGALMDHTEFRKPVPESSLVEFIGKVKSIGNTSLKVSVEVFSEEMYAERRELCVLGEFSLVAIGEDKKAVKILD